MSAGRGLDRAPNQIDANFSRVQPRALHPSSTRQPMKVNEIYYTITILSPKLKKRSLCTVIHSEWEKLTKQQRRSHLKRHKKLHNKKKRRRDHARHVTSYITCVVGTHIVLFIRWTACCRFLSIFFAIRFQRRGSRDVKFRWYITTLYNIVEDTYQVFHKRI